MPGFRSATSQSRRSRDEPALLMILYFGACFAHQGLRRQTKAYSYLPFLPQSPSRWALRNGKDASSTDLIHDQAVGKGTKALILLSVLGAEQAVHPEKDNDPWVCSLRRNIQQAGGCQPDSAMKTGRAGRDLLVFTSSRLSVEMWASTR